MQQKIINVKKGDSFFVLCTYKNSDDVPESLENITIKSQIRDKANRLVSNLTVNILNQSGENLGKFTLSSPTDSWPASELDWDIQYTSQDGTINSTDTLTIRVVKGITE